MKAVFWWCHAHSGDARTAKEKLATMPRDSDIDLLYDVYSASRKHDDGRPEWGCVSSRLRFSKEQNIFHKT